jgi:hypothetical protein
VAQAVREPAYQTWGPEFKPLHTKKQNKQTQNLVVSILLYSTQNKAKYKLSTLVTNGSNNAHNQKKIIPYSRRITGRWIGYQENFLLVVTKRPSCQSLTIASNVTLEIIHSRQLESKVAWRKIFIISLELGMYSSHILFIITQALDCISPQECSLSFGSHFALTTLYFERKSKIFSGHFIFARVTANMKF